MIEAYDDHDVAMMTSSPSTNWYTVDAVMEGEEHAPEIDMNDYEEAQEFEMLDAEDDIQDAEIPDASRLATPNSHHLHLFDPQLLAYNPPIYQPPHEQPVLALPLLSPAEPLLPPVPDPEPEIPLSEPPLVILPVTEHQSPPPPAEEEPHEPPLEPSSHHPEEHDAPAEPSSPKSPVPVISAELDTHPEPEPAHESAPQPTPHASTAEPDLEPIPVVLSISSDTPTFSMFASSSKPDQQQEELSLLFADRVALFYGPLPQLFEAIRKSEHFHEKFSDLELVITAPELGLSISEDHRQAPETSLNDIELLYNTWSLKKPLWIRLDAETPRFGPRLLFLQAGPQAGASGDEEEEHHEEAYQDAPEEEHSKPAEAEEVVPPPKTDDKAAHDSSEADQTKEADDLTSKEEPEHEGEGEASRDGEEEEEEAEAEAKEEHHEDEEEPHAGEPEEEKPLTHPEASRDPTEQHEEHEEVADNPEEPSNVADEHEGEVDDHASPSHSGDQAADHQLLPTAVDDHENDPDNAESDPAHVSEDKSELHPPDNPPGDPDQTEYYEADEEEVLGDPDAAGPSDLAHTHTDEHIAHDSNPEIDEFNATEEETTEWPQPTDEFEEEEQYDDAEEDDRTVSSGLGARTATLSSTSSKRSHDALHDEFEEAAPDELDEPQGKRQRLDEANEAPEDES